MRRASLVWMAVVLLLWSSRGWAADSDGPAERLGRGLTPWLDCFADRTPSFSLVGSVHPEIDGRRQAIDFQLDRYDEQALDLRVTHADYAVEIRRRRDAIALALPKHRVVFLGSGEADPEDHLAPQGLWSRLVGPGSSIDSYAMLLMTAAPADLANALLGLTDLADPQQANRWSDGRATALEFRTAELAIQGTIAGTPLHLQLAAVPLPMRSVSDWEGMTVKSLSRLEIERQLTRGIRRTFEILAPSRLLTAPQAKDKQVEHGELRWIDGQRVVLLSGSPEEIGRAHGELLKTEVQRCIDSVLYAFGTVQTVATGRWFREELELAHARLKPHIPSRHQTETRALAASLGWDASLLETVNVFPELFHCSGFALFGQATRDGKLYHGRVLDYMTTIGLQDAATTFIVAADGQIPFANVGYAGFIGSVSGMNAEKISLGEMGGRGEGQWDGVPMATLMRRALEECDSLAEVQQLWRDSPRTCEYFYVFADGEDRSAVGVAATPEKLEFIAPGQSHPRLGEGIGDAIVLSADSRLEELRRRVKERYGAIDTEAGQWLMCRPVAMKSNLHNVLFVPEDGVLYVANADHQQPAAERPYVRLDLQELLRSMKRAPVLSAPLSIHSRFPARDSLAPAEEASPDPQQCIAGLVWQPQSFEVALETPRSGCGDWLVRFPSARPSGHDLNDLVALEWYQAKDGSGQGLHAPAAVIVHESGSSMTVGRLIAQGLRQHGLHTFMIQLPYYGERKAAGKRPLGPAMMTAMQQGIADVRRARDAVAAIPLVDPTRISVQGTSLGGFLTATTAGLDHGFHRVVIFLAGGDLFEVLMHGKRDAAKLRDELEKHGITSDKLMQLLQPIEPLRLAHRIDPTRTWLFSGRFDEVVPLKNSERLASAARLDESHHVKMLATHYSGIVFLPIVLQQMRDIMVEPATAHTLPESQ